MILFTCFFFRRPDSDPFRGNGGIEMPMGTFMQYTKVPIVVYIMATTCPKGMNAPNCGAPPAFDALQQVPQHIVQVGPDEQTE